MLLEHGTKLLFIGDSITDAGRDREWGNGGLGNGYVMFVDALLAVLYPERRIKVVNRGVSGDRITDLRKRWKTDVLDERPDWLTVMIGINDVWRQFDWAEEELNTREEFKEIYLSLLEQLRGEMKGIILMSPFYLEKNREEPMRKMMDDYGSAVKEVAEETGALFIDTQREFDELLTVRPTQAVSYDRIHPFPVGHMILAKSFLRAIGAEGNKKV
ncbi:MAG: GDSL family lipase [Candidatus Hydrogenedentota bacterium]|nr:MAG: GDSL family lipase [Candidatus Hydrogenedentota bacterium]